MQDSLRLALVAWEKVGLAQLQRDLDAQGLGIIENQNQSTTSRKQLADQTKEFKKVPDDDKLNQVKILLKAYQSEIDSMTKRSKFAETCFLTLYKLLSDVPDPVILITSALEQAKQLDQVTSLQTENRRLKEELAASSTQITASKSLDTTISSLKQRLSKYEAMLDEMVAEKVAQKESEMKQIMDEKIRIYKETEHALNRQLNHLMNQISSLQSNHEVAQARLVDNTQKYDEGVAARLAELEIVMMDLERANTKTAQLSNENRLLKEKMSDSVETSQNNEKINQLHNQIRLAEAENIALIEQLDDVTAAQKNLEVVNFQILQDQKRDQAMKLFEIAQLQSQLAEFSDYEEIKKELDIIKGIEFDGFVESEISSSVVDHPLEKLVLAKNKKLQNDVTTLKTELQNMQEKLAQYTLTKDSLEAQLTESKSLIVKLEADLLQLNPSCMASPQKYTSMDHGLESIMLDNLSKTNHPVTGGNIPGTADASIVSILTSQRDRYKQRFEEVEQNMREHIQTISDLRYEIANFKADNVKLYEKLRYAESYSNTRFQGTNNRHSSAVDITADRYSNNQLLDQDSVSTKYRGIYEESLDPFKRFHKQEEQRRFHSMNPAERAALSLTRLLSTNKYSRWIFVIYSGALHLLVFFTLFQLSMSDCSRAKQDDIWAVQSHDTSSPS
ncbi:hypothetical protein QVD99_004545 [Batrachochytrium dendrobatidis]|nr:hypothetical protein O5D80_002782 [Batrachochytrium dendrobatidis]KAK5668750.1 hypothetical protein QVD99_004545 [Batrachochytrium dendrobatidis]